MNKNSGKERSNGQSNIKRPLPARRDTSEPRTKAEDRGAPEIQPTSSFSQVMPSRASIETMIARSNDGKASSPIFLTGLVGTACLFVLIVLDGLRSPYAYGWALLLTGLLCAFCPPRAGISRWMDSGALLFLIVLLSAFFPQFYWPDADWRVLAEGPPGIDLPQSLSIQPWVSFEIWVQFAAALAWFYAVSAWPLNLTGRKWLYFSFSTFLSLLGFVILWGLFVGGEIIGSFHLIQSQAFNTCLMSTGAVLCFVFAMTNLHARDFAHFSGLFGCGMSLSVLYASGSGEGVLLFGIGVGAWYLSKFRSVDVPRSLKVAIPFVLLGLLVLAYVEEVTGLFSKNTVLDREVEKFSTVSSAFRMILDAPLTGVGLGNFEAILGQYQNLGIGHQAILDAGSDLVLFTAEVGALGVLAALGFGCGYLMFFRKNRTRNSGKLREPARFALIVFCLCVLVEQPAHNLGAGYYGLFLMVLALPRRNSSQGYSVPLFVWRGFGLVFCVIGLLWVSAATFKLPLLSEVARNQFNKGVSDARFDGSYSAALRILNDLSRIAPLDPEVHFNSGEILLIQGGSIEEASAAFARARLSAPRDGQIPLREGIFLAEHDIDRAMDAWSTAFTYDLEDPESVVFDIVGAAEGKPRLQRRLGSLLDQNPEHTGAFLKALKGRVMKREIEKYLRSDPELGEMSRELRTSIVLNWAMQGGGEKASAFLDQHEGKLDFAWWARAVIAKDRADFESAINLIRSHVTSPSLPGENQEIDDVFVTRREFDLSPSDLTKGGGLLRIYLDQGDYAEALSISEDILENSKNLSLPFLYWKAESLYHLGDLIESWFAFQLFVEQGILPDASSG